MLFHSFGISMKTSILPAIVFLPFDPKMHLKVLAVNAAHWVCHSMTLQQLVLERKGRRRPKSDCIHYHSNSQALTQHITWLIDLHAPSLFSSEIENIGANFSYISLSVSALVTASF